MILTESLNSPAATEMHHFIQTLTVQWVRGEDANVTILTDCYRFLNAPSTKMTAPVNDVMPCSPQVMNAAPMANGNGTNNNFSSQMPQMPSTAPPISTDQVVLEDSAAVVPSSPPVEPIKEIPNSTNPAKKNSNNKNSSSSKKNSAKNNVNLLHTPETVPETAAVDKNSKSNVNTGVSETTPSSFALTPEERGKRNENTAATAVANSTTNNSTRNTANSNSNIIENNMNLINTEQSAVVAHIEKRKGGQGQSYKQRENPSASSSTCGSKKTFTGWGKSPAWTTGESTVGKSNIEADSKKTTSSTAADRESTNNSSSRKTEKENANNSEKTTGTSTHAKNRASSPPPSGPMASADSFPALPTPNPSSKKSSVPVGMAARSSASNATPMKDKNHPSSSQKEKDSGNKRGAGRNDNSGNKKQENSAAKTENNARNNNSNERSKGQSKGRDKPKPQRTIFWIRRCDKHKEENIFKAIKRVTDMFADESAELLAVKKAKTANSRFDAEGIFQHNKDCDWMNIIKTMTQENNLGFYVERAQLDPVLVKKKIEALDAGQEFVHIQKETEGGSGNTAAKTNEKSETKDSAVKNETTQQKSGGNNRRRKKDADKADKA